MNDIFFTADTHYDHKRIIEFSERPFDNLDEMNEIRVKNWNDRVKPGDRVYHLGDFSLGPEDRAVAFSKRLMGQKFYIFGNHDKRLRKNKDFLSQWVWAKDLDHITIGDQKIVLCHYPFLTWAGSHRGAWDLHGHSHGSLKDDPGSLRVDVGVDCFNYAPVSFEEIQVLMKKKEFVPVDHHGRRDE